MIGWSNVAGILVMLQKTNWAWGRRDDSCYHSTMYHKEQEDSDASPCMEASHDVYVEAAKGGGATR